MTSIEENTSNHEIISALIVAVGMISLMMNQMAGLLIILAGTGLLIMVYGYRLFTLPKKIEEEDRQLKIGRINYFILILTLVLMVFLIFSEMGKHALTISGMTFLLVLAIANLMVYQKGCPRIDLHYCLMRIGLIMMLLLLFYFFPIR